MRQYDCPKCKFEGNFGTIKIQDDILLSMEDTVICKNCRNISKAKEFVIPYCEECNYFQHILKRESYPGVTYPTDDKECHHPKNKGTWFSRKGLKKHPSFINYENKCNWFEFKIPETQGGS